VEFPNRLGSALLDRVRYAENSGDLTVDGREHHCLTFIPERLCALAKHPYVYAKCIHQREVAERDIMVVHVPFDALSGERLEVHCGVELEASLFCPAHNGLSERVLTPAL
jgi:hypothetical protein